MSDKHTTRKNTYFLLLVCLISLYKLKELVCALEERYVGTTFASDAAVMYKSLRNGLLSPLSSHAVTSTSKAIVTYLRTVALPKLSFSKWILSSCQAQEHYSLLLVETQMGRSSLKKGRSSLKKVPCLLLGQINPLPPVTLPQRPVK